MQGANEMVGPLIELPNRFKLYRQLAAGQDTDLPRILNISNNHSEGQYCREGGGVLLFFLVPICSLCTHSKHQSNFIIRGDVLLLGQNKSHLLKVWLVA